jgi:hypothetical protein
VLHIVNNLALFQSTGICLPHLSGAADWQWWYGHNVVGFFNHRWLGHDGITSPKTSVSSLLILSVINRSFLGERWSHPYVAGPLPPTLQSWLPDSPKPL